MYMTKRTIFTGLELLLVVSEPNTERCANEDRRWIVRSHIGWRGEQNIPCMSVETSPY